MGHKYPPHVTKIKKESTILISPSLLVETFQKLFLHAHNHTKTIVPFLQNVKKTA
jgi:hypothetical protein